MQKTNYSQISWKFISENFSCISAFLMYIDQLLDTNLDKEFIFKKCNEIIIIIIDHA